MNHAAIIARNGTLGEVRRLWRIANKRYVTIPYQVLERAVGTLMLYLLKAKNVARPAYDRRSDEELVEELAYAFFLLGHERRARRLRLDVHDELMRRAGPALLYCISSQIEETLAIPVGPEPPPRSLVDVPEPRHAHQPPVRFHISPS